MSLTWKLIMMYKYKFVMFLQKTVLITILGNAREASTGG